MPDYELIDSGESPEVYRLMADLIRDHHDDLAEARIALAWILEVKPDKDGHLVWGKCRKVGPVEQCFHAHDFVVLLNAKVWGSLPDVGKRALLDHELTHATSDENEAGETVYRIKKHDVEDFVPIVRRYGLWKDDLRTFVEAATGKEQAQLFEPKKTDDVEAKIGPKRLKHIGK
jgi:hypothetical protein